MGYRRQVAASKMNVLRLKTNRCGVEHIGVRLYPHFAVSQPTATSSKAKSVRRACSIVVLLPMPNGCRKRKKDLRSSLRKYFRI